MNDSKDRLLALLASAERREVIAFFERNGVQSASIEVLTSHIARAKVETDGETPSTEKTKIRLHHVHLPKLDAYGVVEYDSRSREVRYCPDEEVEAIVRYTSDLSADS